LNIISSFSEGKSLNLPASKSLSQDLKDEKAKPSEALVLTEKLPEVILVAEQLQELLPSAKNILSVERKLSTKMKMKILEILKMTLILTMEAQL
jgi:hypothetical protein